jgi:hypothetical protein
VVWTTGRRNAETKRRNLTRRTYRNGKKIKTFFEKKV